MAKPENAVTQDTTFIKIGYFSSEVHVEKDMLPQIEGLLQQRPLDILVLKVRSRTDNLQIAGFRHHFASGDWECLNMVYIRDGTRCSVIDRKVLVLDCFLTETPLPQVMVFLNGLQSRSRVKRLLKQIELACTTLGRELPKGFVSIAGIQTSHKKFSEKIEKKLGHPPASATKNLQFRLQSESGVSHVISPVDETVISVDNLFPIGSEKGYLTTCEIPVNANSPIAQRVAQPLLREISVSDGLPIKTWIRSQINDTNHFVCSLVCRFLEQPNFQNINSCEKVRVWKQGSNKVEITVVIAPKENCHVILTALKKAIKLLGNIEPLESTCTLFYTPSIDCIWCPNTEEKRLEAIYEDSMRAYPISVKDDFRIFPTKQARRKYCQHKPANK